MGDIDISNEGMFCHRDGINNCGSGKPENLTILFKQKNSPIENKLICNRDDISGGIKIKNSKSYNINKFPIDNNLLPGSTFLMDNTSREYERNLDEKFGAFTYGPRTTFFTSKPKSKWIQVLNPNFKKNKSLIITSRGSYGYIKNAHDNSIEDNIVNLILNTDLKLIPYGGNDENINNNIEIIGIGKKIENIPSNSQFNKNATQVFLIFDSNDSTYHLRSFSTVNINRINKKNHQNSFPASFAILNTKNLENNIELGTSNNLRESLEVKQWLEIFDIEIKERDRAFAENYTGAIWVKNFCLDNSVKTWIFSKEFVNKLTLWHGNEYNWGRKSYRGKSIILWDTLREFKLN